MINRPKRRRHKDNPYYLECYENKTYKVSFKNGQGICETVEITEEIFKAMDRFELDDKKEMNEYDNHIEHSEIYEETLYNKNVNKEIGLEDYIIRKSTFEELKEAINSLPEIQKRRIKKYYFDDKTEEQIAREENTTQQSVHIILSRAIKNLQKILKNLN